MSTRVSDKAWLAKMEEKLQPQTEAFYVLLFFINDQPHVKVGYTGKISTKHPNVLKHAQA